MKHYKYVVIDDDDLDILIISHYLKQYPFLEHCASFSNPLEGLDYVLNNKVDVVFLDINMPHMDGLEIQKQIKEHTLCTVFHTSYTQSALQAFELDVFDFIVKPFTEEKIHNSVRKIQTYLEQNYKSQLFDMSFNNNSIMIKEGYNYVSIQVSDIAYMEALKDYTKLISLNKKITVVHNNIGTMLNNENFSHFIRIHKSYAVQKNYIQKIVSNEVVLVNEVVLPIGQSFKKKVLTDLSAK